MCFLVVRRFLTDLPKGLDSFNDICMEQQADSHVLEDNKKHVASIVQVRLMHSRLRRRAAAGCVATQAAGRLGTTCAGGWCLNLFLGGSGVGSRSPAPGISACTAAGMGEACRGSPSISLWLPCRRRSRAPAPARR